jgi:uncharacterized membrane protein
LDLQVQKETTMAHTEVIGAAESPPLPSVRKITPADLRDALARGLDDFRAMPTTNVIFLGLIYPIVGLILARLTFGYDVVPLLFPIAAGFALIGPLAAVWLYELSRRREQGLDVAWHHAFDVLHARSLPAIAALGLLLMAIFVVWVAVAQAIYVANFGYAPPESFTSFLSRVFTTREGWTLIVVGNAVGFVFALLVLTISVVSFPLLLDRNVGALMAVVTSVKAVASNPGTMAMWGLIVAVALVAGSIPLFLGLAIVVPVLGHATWHLYRKTVEADQTPPQEFRPAREHHRSAADFPASLFPARGDQP